MESPKYKQYKRSGTLSDVHQITKVIYITENAEEDSDMYTKLDFMQIAKGNKDLAEALFGLCEWQHPETILDEMLREGEIVETENGYEIVKQD